MAHILKRTVKAVGKKKNKYQHVQAKQLLMVLKLKTRRDSNVLFCFLIFIFLLVLNEKRHFKDAGTGCSAWQQAESGCGQRRCELRGAEEEE